jgi:hypothetical protein
MAMIDYGAIAFKNGKLISTEMFTPMIDTVGWEDTEDNTYTHYEVNGKSVELPLELKGNYFAYIGDIDCTIAFYKTSIIIVEMYNSKKKKYFRTYENFSNSFKWSKWDCYAGMSRVKVTRRNGYYVCKWKYKGDKYKVYFGYGVDLSYYKKWRMVNYYRSPKHLARKVKWWIKDKIDDFKWKHGWE